jgi:magnesium chelatase family protein
MRTIEYGAARIDPGRIASMSLAILNSRALDGLAAPPVQVEVHLANGLPSFTLVGLADTEVKEARERVRAALASSGLRFPHNKRITVNLAPADLPKESGRFDLPIALGILAAERAARRGRAGAPRVRRRAEPGRRAAPGARRAGAGAGAARHEGARPHPGAARGQRGRGGAGGGVPVLQARHLLDVVAALQPGDAAKPLPEAVPATP